MKSKSLRICANFLVFFILFEVSNAKNFDKDNATAEIKKIVESAKVVKKNLNNDLSKLENLEASFPDYFAGPTNTPQENEKVSQMNVWTFL